MHCEATIGMRLVLPSQDKVQLQQGVSDSRLEIALCFLKFAVHTLSSSMQCSAGSSFRCTSGKKSLRHVKVQISLSSPDGVVHAASNKRKAHGKMLCSV